MLLNIFLYFLIGGVLGALAAAIMEESDRDSAYVVLMSMFFWPFLLVFVFSVVLAGFLQRRGKK